MKFLDTKGREHKMDIRPSKWKVKELGRGKFQSLVGEILKNKFSNSYVLEEFPCVGEGLWLDFFVPRERLAVEVQGKQHYEFNAFFHKSKSDFLAQRNRDKIKEQWCKINNIRLVKIDYGESEKNILSRLS